MKQLLFLLLLIPSISYALDTDWGVIQLQDGEKTSISFSAYDRMGNFADHYSFSLLASSDANYSISVTFDPCKNGCGNPDFEYGLYSSNGGLISDTGSALLTSGSYVLKVSSTGMGAGNSLDYFGNITFGSDVQMVAAVPEPDDYLLFFFGICILIFALSMRKIIDR